MNGIDSMDEMDESFPLSPIGGEGWGEGAVFCIDPTHKPRSFVTRLEGATRKQLTHLITIYTVLDWLSVE